MGTPAPDYCAAVNSILATFEEPLTREELTHIQDHCKLRVKELTSIKKTLRLSGSSDRLTEQEERDLVECQWEIDNIQKDLDDLDALELVWIEVEDETVPSSAPPSGNAVTPDQ